MSPQDLDHIGWQATHEGQIEVLRKERDGLFKKWIEAEQDVQEFESLERLYARAIDAQAQLERTLTAAQNEANRLLGEKRVLKEALEELVRVREEQGGPGAKDFWLDGSDGRYARARKALGRE
jgi:chromosome segregation ATPase